MDELTHHPCDHVPYSTIKSTRIPKYNAKRSDLTHLPSDQVPQSSFKSARIPKYNAKRLTCVDSPFMRSRAHSSIKSNRIPKYNAKRSSFHAITSPIRAINPIGYPNTTRSDRDDLKHLTCDEVSQSSIKSARIPKYSVKRLNVFIQDLKHLSCEHEPHPSNKIARTPKYNAKRSV
ncbi:uncharacterized protein G2W53_040329 [Senna tora]|uniref:Uncharacterized protein n=1 Tax=Senna tora TaxID=362788 RepID=A0A834SRX8_9FABA|nr:uncharacterized protein G2W53_040329 [Senna tora]